MMASLGRPMAATKLGAGGGSGAVAMPSTMSCSGKCSSCDLCSATSRQRAAICTVPARLHGGASTMGGGAGGGTGGRRGGSGVAGAAGAGGGGGGGGGGLEEGPGRGRRRGRFRPCGARLRGR